MGVAQGHRPRAATAPRRHRPPSSPPRAGRAVPARARAAGRSTARPRPARAAPGPVPRVRLPLWLPLEQPLSQPGALARHRSRRRKRACRAQPRPAPHSPQGRSDRTLTVTWLTHDLRSSEEGRSRSILPLPHGEDHQCAVRQRALEIERVFRGDAGRPLPPAAPGERNPPSRTASRNRGNGGRSADDDLRLQVETRRQVTQPNMGRRLPRVSRQHGRGIGARPGAGVLDLAQQVVHGARAVETPSSTSASGFLHHAGCGHPG